MSTVRITTFLAFTTALVLAAFAVKLPEISSLFFSKIGMSDALTYSLFMDGAARLGVGILVFGLIFGITAALSNYYFGTRPILELAEKLNLRPHDMTSNKRDLLIDSISDSRSLREPFAKLHLQLSARHFHQGAELDTPMIPVPVHQLIAQTSLLGQCVNNWFIRAITILLLVFGMMLFAWSVASGADSQAQNVANASYGHPSGVLLGLRGGSFAVLCSLVGAGAVYFLGLGSHAYAATQAERLIAKINGLTLISGSTEINEIDTFDRSTKKSNALSATDLKKIIVETANKISANQSIQAKELNAKLQELVTGLTGQLNETQRLLIDGQGKINDQLNTQFLNVSKYSSDNQSDELILKITSLLEASQSHTPMLGGITQALSDVKNALTDLKLETRRMPNLNSSGIMLKPNNDVTKKLATAIKALKEASDSKAS
jgi:hypothetical protein